MGDFKKGVDVGGADAGAGHDDEAGAGEGDELREERGAGLGLGLMPGGEQPLTSQRKNNVESGERICTDIESTMESDR